MTSGYDYTEHGPEEYEYETILNDDGEIIGGVFQLRRNQIPIESEMMYKADKTT